MWFSEVYLKTPEGRGLPKNVKQQIHHISDAVVHRTRRSQLLPGTIDVLAIWEDIPLVPGTSEWGVARVRLIGHLLAHGLFRESQAQGLVVTQQEIAEARLWLYKKPDGTVSRFEPIRQPWHFKDLLWVPEPNTGGIFKHIVEVHTSEQGMEIAVAEQDQNNPEARRISPQTLNQLMRAPIQPDKSPTAQTSQARNIAAPRRLRDTVGQSQNEAHPAQNPREQNSGALDGRANRTRTQTDQSSDDEQSEELVIISTKRIRVAGPMVKPESEGADDAALGETSMTTRPAFSTGSTIDPSRSSRRAAQLFGTDQWTSPERDIDETANSEATTDILRRNDTEMVGSGDGPHDEQNKENRPVSGFEIGLGDEDDRLEVRIVQDMYATSEDELSANTNNTVVDY